MQIAYTCYDVGTCIQLELLLVCVCFRFTLYDKKVCEKYSNILLLLFCHNITLWIVLVGAAKSCVALWVLNELVNK